nr:SulP family inorganic anion transporter [uncultured Gellertiella sp.]
MEIWRNGLAGLSVAGLMLPEAVAYAGIAGLPPERAILAGIAGAVAYAAVGQSRFAIVAPTSSSAAILAATLAAIPGGVAARAGFSTWIVLLTGGLFLLAALLRLGGLTGFISRPVLKGFAFGLAVTIILHQLPDLLGFRASGTNLAAFGADLFHHLPQVHAASLALGAASLAFLLAVRRFRHVPGPLLVLVAGVSLSRLAGLSALGVEMVGDIGLRLTWPDLPALDWPVLSGLAQYAVPLVLILFAESWGTVRSLALSHGDRVSANRELSAFAAANLASALTGGMPVGAGFSAGSASQAAGASGRLAGLVAALALALLVVFGHGLIADLPKPVPAAVIIAALSHALDPKPFLRLWRLGRDNYLAFGTAAGILTFGVLDGMLLAIVLSLIALLRRLSAPVIARLAPLGGGRDYVDAARHPDAALASDLAVFRPAAPLFYANADTVLSTVAARVAEDPAIRRVVLSLEESFDVDTTALDQLTEFDQSLQARGLRLHYARVHDHLRDLFELAGETDLLSRCYYSVDDAVRAMDVKPVRPA